MCKTKKSTDVIQPSSTRLSRPKQPEPIRSSRKSSGEKSTSFNLTSANHTSSYNNNNDSWQSSTSSATSLTSLRESLSENARIYSFSEICAATNNFSAKKFSSSSSSASWRCDLRSNDVVIFQRKLRRPIHSDSLRERLSLIHKSHHTSLVKLRGASVSGNYIYLVYDFVAGGNLADCLRNPRNPNFTVLSKWMSRMQIATDLAHGLDYLHHSTGSSSGFVHNHIKTSSIIVTDPSFNAKICHFGTADLCGEIEPSESESSKYERSDSRVMKFQGTRGYMSPEFQTSGVATRKSDVYAFGVVVLELLSGQEALKYMVDQESGGYKRFSVIETAKEAVDGGGVRRWVDERLRDSYPVEVAEKMVRVGLECVEEDPGKRPDMRWVAGRISKLYLESSGWAEKVGVPTDFTVSLAPR